MGKLIVKQLLALNIFLLSFLYSNASPPSPPGLENVSHRDGYQSRSTRLQTRL